MIRIELPGCVRGPGFREGPSGTRGSRNGLDRCVVAESYIVRLWSVYALEIRKSTETDSLAASTGQRGARPGWNPVAKVLRAPDGLRPSPSRAKRIAGCGARYA